jgi:hypothetical protein
MATTPRRAPLGIVIVLVALATACGGKLVGDEGDAGRGTGTGGTGTGGTGGGSGGNTGGGPAGSASGGTGSEGPDASAHFDASSLPPGVVCSGTSGGGGGGASSCQRMMNETCSDGYTYQVSCSCPEATCDCFQSSSGGGSSTGGGQPYDGCPTCSTANLWKACGFPQ